MCRVEGEFPEGEVVCEEPILVTSFKIGFCRADPKGKDSRTVFNRLSFNGKTSVVRCLPLTGRTHQIRVHLQYLGFPILSDPIYGSSAWGPHRGKGGVTGKSDEELLKALMEEHQSQESLFVSDDGFRTKIKSSEKDEKSGVPSKEDVGSKGCSTQSPEVCGTSEVAVNETSQGSTDGDGTTVAAGEGRLSTESNGHQPSTDSRDNLCSECKLLRPDPTERELIMYLHALRYKGPDFEYSTRLPDWAREDWEESDLAAVKK